MKTLLAPLATLCALAISVSLSGQISFTNQTSLLHEPNSFSSGGPVAVADVDNDGRDDIIRLEDGHALNVEYQQAAGQPFSHSFIIDAPGGAWALAVADINNDGTCDMLFGGAYDQGVKLVRSTNNGNAYQMDILSDSYMFVQGSNFADINNDGFLDAFACHDDAESRIWGNDGTGALSPANNWIDMATSPPSDNSGNYGTTWTDFDNDGDTDLYISKCRGGVSNPSDPRRINALFVNDGNGNYTEQADEYGLKIGHQTWASDFQDIDNDGDLDCLVANHDHNLQLFENDGTGHFTDISAQAGTAGFTHYFIQALMRDFDNDGFVDIITSSPPLLLHNNGNKTFTQIPQPFTDMGSLATGDLNHDGFLDVYAVYQCGLVSPCGNPDILWLNNGNSNHYLAVQLQGNQSNYKGVGAKVEIRGSWGIQVREVRSGESYGISNSLTSYFGLGDETQIESLMVKWPSGTVDLIAEPGADQFLLIEEGSTCVSESPAGSNNYVAVPDAALTLDNIACANGGAQVLLTICNEGSNILPTNLPVAFYKNDPRQAGAELVEVVNTGAAVAPDGCQQFTFSVNAVLGAALFAVANDDGTLPLPFDPSTSLPATNLQECRFENNISSITLQHTPPALDLGNAVDLCNVSSVMLDAGNSFDTYLWQDGSSAPTFNATVSGQYWVEAWDACGIKQADSVLVTLSQAPPLELGDDVLICESENLPLAVSGYSNVQWAPATGLSCNDCPNPIASPENSTTYYVEASEGSCFSSDSIQVSVAQPAAIALASTDSDCSTAASISATADGNGPFNFVWSSGETGQEIAPSQTGTYSVTVTDANTCQATASAAVTVFQTFTFETYPTDVLCASESNGSVNLVLDGGDGPFTFQWSDGTSTEDLNNVPTGSYSLTITDANGCSQTTAVNIGEPDAIALQPEISEIPCAGGTGSISPGVTGGTAPLTFLWSNGSASQNIGDLPAGEYSLTITDANHCGLTYSATLDEPEAIALQPEISEILCAGGTGSISPGVSGGTAPLTFLWSNGSASQNIGDLPAGDYSLTITDANHCGLTYSATLDEPQAIAAQADITDIQCSTDGLGSIAVNASGGTAPLSFLWENGVSAPQITVAAPGQFTVSITDAKGCEKTLENTVGLSGNLLVETSSTPISCHPNNGEASDGTATATPTNGLAPFTWLWQNGQAGTTLTGLGSGNYSATVTDAIGCSAPVDILLLPPTELLASATLSDTLLCPGETASATATANGGTPPYQFVWEGGETGNMLTGLLAGNYPFTVTDDKGCSSSNEADIAGSLPIEIGSDTIIAASSATALDGAIVLSEISGSSPPYSFLWNNGASGQSIEGVAPGSYDVTITGADGCGEVFSFEVDVMVATGELPQPEWKLQLYPNPSSAGREIQLSIHSPAPQNIDFQLFDLTGRLLGQQYFPVQTAVFYKKIKMPEAAGLYLLRLVDEEGKGLYRKVVVE